MFPEHCEGDLLSGYTSVHVGSMAVLFTNSTSQEGSAAFFGCSTALLPHTPQMVLESLRSISRQRSDAQTRVDTIDDDLVLIEGKNVGEVFNSEDF